jgi:hypothetical protein
MNQITNVKSEEIPVQEGLWMLEHLSIATSRLSNRKYEEIVKEGC